MIVHISRVNSKNIQNQNMFGVDCIVRFLAMTMLFMCVALYVQCMLSVLIVA